MNNFILININNLYNDCVSHDFIMSMSLSVDKYKKNISILFQGIE